LHTEPPPVPEPLDEALPVDELVVPLLVLLVLPVALLPPVAPVNPLPVPDVTNGHPAALATRRHKTAIFELRMPLLRGAGPARVRRGRSDHGPSGPSSERRRHLQQRKPVE
jgi:hypothetical protein